MNTRQTEASFARLSRDDENNGAANKTGYMPETIPGCIDIFFFSSVERKRVKKKKLFSERIKKIFVTVYLMRSHAYARPRSVVALKRFPSFPAPREKKNDPLKGDGRRSGDVPRKGCRRTGCTPFV